MGRAREWRVRLLSWLLAAAAGLALYVSFPPRTLWWLAPLAFAMLGALLRGRRPGAGFALGMLFGVGFLMPLLSWTGYFVGSMPWVVLGLFESRFLGLAGAGMAAVSRRPGGPV